MRAVMTAALMNAACASVLACVVALACRWVKRPAAAHVLWLVVLLELLGPPVLRVGVVPPALQSWIVTEPDQPTTQVASASPRPAEGPAALEPPGQGGRRAGTGALLSTEGVAVAALGVWAAGTVAWLALTCVRWRRFARLLAAAASPSPCLEERVSRLARRMGLSRCPRVRLVAARVSPMLRPRLGRIELLFPAGLLSRLDEFERDTLLAHELAHVRRRDHWVRYVELTAVALFWWHPVVWWARARLRRAEEQACDGWVVQTMPARSRAYARALVKTVQFLAGSERPLPALASGLGEVRHLKERLTMIVRSSSNPNLSRPSRSALALAALAALLIFPTWAEPPVEDRGAPSGPAAEQDVDTAYRERVRQLEQEAAELENELRGVHARRMEIELEWQQRHLSAELDRLRAQAAELEASGREPEALETLEQARLREVRSQIELERVRLQQEIERQVALHQRSIEHRAIERRLEHAIAEAGEREHRIEAAQLEVEIEHMRATAERLREDGRTEEAARLERQLESMLMERSARESEDRLRSRREIEMLLREASELEARGDDERAREIRAFVEDLLESMEDEAGTIR